MDHLSEILSDVYVSGTVFGRARFGGDWQVFTNGTPFAIFHAVTTGACSIVWDEGRRSLDLEVGDVVVVPSGSPHVMCDRPDVVDEPVWIGDVFGDTDGMVARAHHVASGEGAAEIICGTFEFDQRLPNRLLQALPAVVRIRGDEQGGWVSRTVQWLAEEIDSSRPGSDAMVIRLTDALFVNILRACLEEAARAEESWLSAVSDENLARAIAAIHSEPGGDWTATSLARVAGMSRSAFYDRFTELVGETPARYLASHRMEVAAYHLTSDEMSVSEAAAHVGYRSESSFSKAFKRHFGLPPSDYRDRQLEAS